MQFLKGLFWILLIALVVVFCFGNWNEIGTIQLWGGLVAEIKIPILVFICFAAGLLPTLLYHHAVRWRLRGRLANSERTIADLRAATMTASADPAPVIDAEPPPMPPGSA
jgi:hypothetical protein